MGTKQRAFYHRQGIISSGKFQKTDSGNFHAWNYRSIATSPGPPVDINNEQQSYQDSSVPDTLEHSDPESSLTPLTPKKTTAKEIQKVHHKHNGQELEDEEFDGQDFDDEYFETQDFEDEDDEIAKLRNYNKFVLC